MEIKAVSYDMGRCFSDAAFRPVDAFFHNRIGRNSLDIFFLYGTGDQKQCYHDFSHVYCLIAGYIIAREAKDNTLKSILTIPVSYSSLLWGKLLVCALLSLFFGLASAAFTVIADLMMGFPGISVTSILQTFIQIISNCLFLYIGVMPVIAFAARIPNGHMIGTIIAFVYGYGGMFASGNAVLANIYPVTASLGLIRYRSYDSAVHWNVSACLFSMIAALMISAVFVFTAKGNVPVKKAKKRKKAIARKGW